ncbi:MAG: M28 family peptidase [Pirellula sp.]
MHDRSKFLQITWIFAILLHFNPNSHADDAAEARLLADIKYLASDELQGRAAENPGLEMAAEFIANRFAVLGLKTDLFEGKAFQEFTLDGSIEAPAAKNSLSISVASGEIQSLKLQEEYLPQTLGKNGSFDAEMVFAGYGITATDLNYDDYANIDVRGKVVIVLRKEPQANDPKSPFDGTEPSQHALFTTKEINAAKHGAAAMILVNDASSEAASPNSLLPLSSGGGLIKDQIPTLFMKRSILQEWLKTAGRSLKEIESTIDRELKPQSFVLPGFRAKGSVAIERTKLRSINVLGLLPGQGALANQYVVVGAHFDHVGMGGAGSLAPGTIAVHNGADDNASGTVSLLECARRLAGIAKENPTRDRRNILFITFSGEERGLLGSIYYVNHPRFELEQTVAMLNMDMVGRLTNNELTVYGTGTAKEFDGMLDTMNSKLAFNIQRMPEGLGPSDHESFFRKDIPVLHFFTGLHDDYHRPRDDFDKINFEGMERIARMVTDLTDRIATDANRPSFIKVTGRANPQSNRTRTVRLGVRLNGMVVDRVLPRSLAEKAGIQAGDTLIAVNSQEISSRSELDTSLRKSKKGDELAIGVLRGNEKVTLKVVLVD